MQPIITAEYLASQGFSETFLFRFWEKVFIPDDPSVGCWTWTQPLSRNKRGQIQRGGRHSRPIECHRASWVIHFGSVPSGLEVMHICDNPPCIRPDHLVLGHHIDNVRDCLRKNRFSIGENHYAAVFTEDEAKWVIKQRANGMLASTMATLLNRNVWAIWKIIQGKNWKHLARTA